MAKGDDVVRELQLNQFWPPYMIDLFASQRTLVVGKSYDGAGTVRSITASSLGVLVVFDRGPVVPQKQMLLTAAGWGWL